MKKIFLFSFCLLLALLKHKMFIAPIKIYLMSLVPKRTPIVRSVVNWIFIILKTRRISQLSFGFMAVVWKVEINLFPKN